MLGKIFRMGVIKRWVYLGVLSRDPGVLLEVVRFLLQQPNLEWSPPKQVIIADDCFGLSTISSMRTSDVMARAVSETLGRRYR